jgi:hypothetical protein
MARQSFRGAGGAGAVVLPYDVAVLPYEQSSATAEHDAAVLRGETADADLRVAGALAIVASGVLVAVGIFLAGWTIAG